MSEKADKIISAIKTIAASADQSIQELIDEYNRMPVLDQRRIKHALVEKDTINDSFLPCESLESAIWLRMIQRADEARNEMLNQLTKM